MRRLTIALTLFLVQTAYAKDRIVIPTEIHCFKAEVLIKELLDVYSEEPIIIGKSELDKDATTMVFVNQQTGSYTIVNTGKGIACVLDTGNTVKYRMPKVLENKLM